MYKRTKDDSPLKCPYCNHQFTVNGRRWITHKGFNETTCFYCGERFYFLNITAKYAREHNIKATYKPFELQNKEDFYG